MGLPGKGRRVRVVRDPDREEPVIEPVVEPAPAPVEEPVTGVGELSRGRQAPRRGLTFGKANVAAFARTLDRAITDGLLTVEWARTYARLYEGESGWGMLGNGPLG